MSNDKIDQILNDIRELQKSLAPTSPISKTTKVNILKTMFVDYKYELVDPLPQSWHTFTKADQEYYLRNNGILMDIKYSEFDTISDGSWLEPDENVLRNYNDDLS